MTKTTFTGYFPKLKAHRAATVKSGKCINPKGSIRYQIKGECMDDEKGLCISLPKMVTREDFEQVYGFDAKEAESVFMADTVGSPSPASVEPPAPSEKPFPQEPSNENFSAEYEGWSLADLIDARMEAAKEEGIEDWENDSNPNALSGHIQTYIWNHKDFAAEPALCDEDCGRNVEPTYNSDDDEWENTTCDVCLEEVASFGEVKEAFLGIGEDEEEAEPEEEKPKEQEFTVVLQEGDKLELTDIEETEADPEGEKDEDNDGDSENDEKEAELLKHTLMICPACDETIPDDESCIECGTRLRMGSEYEAVQAKVTRPVKEEEDEEEEEEDEGMSTLSKVGLGVGALAIGAAILGAEDEGELDYWAGENAHWRAEGGDADATVVWEMMQQNFNNPEAVRLYFTTIFGDHPHHYYDTARMAEMVAEAVQQNWRNQGFINYLSKELGFDIQEAEGGGQIDHDRVDVHVEETVIMRHDDPTTMYNWETSEDLPEGIDEGDIDSEVQEAIKDELGDEPEEGSDSISMEVADGVAVDVDYETDYGHPGRFYGFAAEDFQKMTSSEFVPFDQITAEIQEEWDETTPSIAADYQPSNEPSNSNFSAEFEAGKHSGKKSRRKKRGMGSLSSSKRNKQTTDWRPFNDRIKSRKEQQQDLEDYERHGMAETVGSPSPSGPSSVPEPAEATGTEPSNEHMEADSSNTKMMLGFTALGIGIAAVLGKDKLSKLFDRFGL